MATSKLQELESTATYDAHARIAYRGSHGVREAETSLQKRAVVRDSPLAEHAYGCIAEPPHPLGSSGRELCQMFDLPIAVVDGDIAEARSAASALRDAGFAVREVSEHAAALELVLAHGVSLILLSLRHPQQRLGAIDLCRQVRQVSGVPIIALATTNDEMDELLVLAVGADECLRSPISPRCLVAHVQALVRRVSGEGNLGLPSDGHDVAGIRIDAVARTVAVHEAAVHLSRIQFDLLAALAEHPNRVLTRRQLIERVWGNWYGSDHQLDVHLCRLRARILEAGGPRVPHAVRGVGFRLLERSGISSEAA